MPPRFPSACLTVNAVSVTYVCKTLNIDNMEIKENVSLLPYNTFGMDVRADFFVKAGSRDDVAGAVSLAKENGLPLLVLSGGSNMLITEDLHAVVLYMDTRGIETEGRDGTDTLVRVQAGENWHGFVQWTVENSLCGAENLAYIPGKAGASPVQNIGAYGAEAKDIIESVEALDVRTLEIRTFTNAQCRFGYRESVFKGEYKGRYIILSVLFRLHRESGYQPRLDYGNIRAYLEREGIASPGIADVARAVTAIRMEKLPDPAKTGNCGSFFKNPVLPRSQFEALSAKYPGMPSFGVENPSDGHYRKIPAAWMIERAGWKGYRRGAVGVHENQALVLVNYGGGTGAQVLELCRDICRDVQEKFGVVISPEVNIVDNGSIRKIDACK